MQRLAPFVLFSLIFAGVALAAPSDLVVTLELAAGRYKITHRYQGDSPRRFITGSSDQNCDGPVDVLIVDGKIQALGSELPCGGLAYRATKTIGPGQAWSLEGASPLGPGKHSVIARYCANAQLLAAVDPKQRTLSSPPWWFGCVDSAPVEIK